MLLIGGVLWWTSSASTWECWPPLVGSFLLASFFVPASVGILQSYFRSEVAGRMQLGIRLVSVLLVLTSLGAAISRIAYGRIRSLG